MHEDRFGQIAGAAGGKVLWTILPIMGAHGRGGHKESPGRLEAFDFATLRAETLLDKVDTFAVAADDATVVVREGKRLRAISALGRRDARADPEASSDAPSRKSGWIDLGRIRLSVEPQREWRQMLREVWRLQRDQFWVADMSGVDWDAVYRRYEPLLARVATRGELSDLIWEMQGELGTSHAYESGGDHRRPPPIALGHLAADLALAEDGSSYEITRIVTGDAWDAGADSPLNAVGVEAKVGERIVAVNGQPRVARSTAAGAARPSGRRQGRADARRGRCATRRRARCWSRHSPTRCRRGTASGWNAIAPGCTKPRAAVSAISTSPT